MNANEQFPKPDIAVEDEINKKIVERIQEASVQYSMVFETAGFDHQPAVGVYSKTDGTVAFIGSTVSPLKPFFMEDRTPQGGVYTHQECIRTQNERILYDDTQIPEYNSSFSIVGGMAPMDRTSQVAESSWEYFTKGLGIDADRLLVKIYSEDKDLKEALLQWNPNVPLQFDSREEEYYRWVYGIPGVQGRGLTFAIRQSDNTYGDIGNIIIMEGGGHTPVIQWGYGIETTLARAQNLERPIAASAISAILPYQTGLRVKYADALSVCLDMYRAGVVPSSKGSQRSLRNYIKGMSYLRRKIGVTKPELEQQAVQYLSIYGEGKEFASELLFYMEKHEERVQNCIRALKRESAKYSPEQMKSLLDDRKIRDHLGDVYGVHREEMQQIIEQVIT